MDPEQWLRWIELEVAVNELRQRVEAMRYKRLTDGDHTHVVPIGADTFDHDVNCPCRDCANLRRCDALIMEIRATFPSEQHTGNDASDTQTSQ